MNTRQAIETFEKNDARCQVARSRLGLADALAARGRASAALAELTIARDVFSQMRAPRLVERGSRAAAALLGSSQRSGMRCH